MIADNRFRKQERLCSVKAIESVFAKGKQYKRYPFRCAYMLQPYNGVPVKIVISVPKKLHKLAVTRNLIKRRMREAYRRNKHILYNALQGNVHTLNLVLIYVSPQISPYTVIEQKIVETLTNLAEKLAKGNDTDSGITN